MTNQPQPPMTETGRDAALRARLENYATWAALGYTARYEATAERFYNATGFMAPGKSVPLEMAQDEAARARAWAKFQTDEGAQYQRDLRAAALLASPDPVVGAVPDPLVRRLKELASDMRSFKDYGWADALDNILQQATKKEVRTTEDHTRPR